MGLEWLAIGLGVLAFLGYRAGMQLEQLLGLRRSAYYECEEPVWMANPSTRAIPYSLDVSEVLV